MFSEVQLLCKVKIYPEELDPDGRVPENTITRRLLMDLSCFKSSESLGYLLAVTNINGKGNTIKVEEFGFLVIPVYCKCRTFLPVKGETLEGVVYSVKLQGVLIRCGPVKDVFLSNLKMGNYRYVCDDEKDDDPMFVRDDDLS